MAFYDKHATSNSIDHTADIMLNATQLTDVNIEQISFHNSDLSDIQVCLQIVSKYVGQAES